MKISDAGPAFAKPIGEGPHDDAMAAILAVVPSGSFSEEGIKREFVTATGPDGWPHNELTIDDFMSVVKVMHLPLEYDGPVAKTVGALIKEKDDACIALVVDHGFIAMKKGEIVTENNELDQDSKVWCSWRYNKLHSS